VEKTRFKIHVQIHKANLFQVKWIVDGSGFSPKYQGCFNEMWGVNKGGCGKKIIYALV
jgi:hypothetical protein